MGACSISGYFYSTDWKNGLGPKILRNFKTGKLEIGEIFQSGIYPMKEEDRVIHGDDPYSGTISTVSFSLSSTVIGKKNDKDEFLDSYVEKRLNKLGKCDGEVTKVCDYGFIICTPEIKPINYCDFDRMYYLKNMKKGPAVLLERDQSYLRVVREGTLADLKKEAIQCTLHHKFTRDYYVIGKNNSFYCGCDAKFQEKTTRKSNNKTLVLPVYKWLYYGWAAE